MLGLIPDLIMEKKFHFFPSIKSYRLFQYGVLMLGSWFWCFFVWVSQYNLVCGLFFPYMFFSTFNFISFRFFMCFCVGQIGGHEVRNRFGISLKFCVWVYYLG